MGRNKIALGIMNEEVDFTPKTTEIIYQCNLCGACLAGCKRNLDLDTDMTLETLRIRAVEKGAAPLPEHKAINDKIVESGNRYGADNSKRSAWLPAGAGPSVNPEMLYFAGCNSSFKNEEIAVASVGILDAIGAEYALFPGEKCCGNPLYESGDADAALKQAEENITALKGTGASTIVTSCAECYKVWKVDYPKLLDKSTEEMPYKVLHITQAANEKIQNGSLTLSHRVNMRVAYHDSCKLTRCSDDWVPWHGERGKYGVTIPPKVWRRGINGVIMEPREILASIPGIELKEMIRNGMNTMCCGAGAGVAEAYPEYARNVANHRLDEAEDIGIEALISSCPYCKDSFSKAAEEAHRPIRCYDVTQVLYESITGRGGL
jgi:Fe-S oxidoreductase